MPDVYYDSTLTGKELDDALRNIPANVERAETAAANAEKSEKNAESWTHGGTGTREGEETDNAEYWAGQARSSAETASTGAQVVTDNEEALQAVKENITAIQNAPQDAGRAEAAADSAEGDAARAEEAADRAQSIGQGALGYYAKAADLQAAHESGENGQWAIVGETDTIWVWDSDTQSWSNSGNKTDLSQYYTKEETDAELDEVQTALGQQITEAAAAAQNAASRRWELSVTAGGWQQEEDGRYSKTLPAEGVTADTRLSPGVGAKPGDTATLDEKKAVQAALGCISELETGDGTVTLTCYEQAPETDFTIILEEVR